MGYNLIILGEREYRYSDERRNSGRPASIQFLNSRGVWRDVRNVDTSDWIWFRADYDAGALTEKKLQSMSFST